VKGIFLEKYDLNLLNQPTNAPTNQPTNPVPDKPPNQATKQLASKPMKAP